MLTLFQMDENPCLTRDSRFTFICGPGVPCFNRCCQAGVIVLNPGDVLRLKRFLQVSSTEFLRRYTVRETEAGSGLPLVFLRPPRGQDTGCPFVTDTGCRVYEARPDACRLFPLAQGSVLTPEGPRDQLYLRQPPYCQGLAADSEWSVADWMAAQGFDPEDPRRRAWVSLLLTRALSGPATPDQQDLFYLAAYDLDNFRAFVLTSAFPMVYGFPAEALAPLADQEEALLRFALAYITATLEEDEPSLVREALREALLAEAPE
ncbi:MAG: YkgJ family cysteine cluster protein [Syntrophobacterales bacterium]|nr:YkgJ family cysteine cluster protein [Syntrophobacterales bacterium]